VPPLLPSAPLLTRTHHYFSRCFPLFFQIQIQLTPALTDFKGPTIFICYRQISVIANIEIKEYLFMGLKNIFCYRSISVTRGSVWAGFNYISIFEMIYADVWFCHTPFTNISCNENLPVTVAIKVFLHFLYREWQKSFNRTKIVCPLRFVRPGVNSLIYITALVFKLIPIIAHQIMMISKSKFCHSQQLGQISRTAI